MKFCKHREVLGSGFCPDCEIDVSIGNELTCDEDELITVCDKCLTSVCWQGLFMCDKSQNAGIIEKTRKELRLLNKEHESYWKKF